MKSSWEVVVVSCLLDRVRLWSVFVSLALATSCGDQTPKAKERIQVSTPDAARASAPTNKPIALGPGVTSTPVPSGLESGEPTIAQLKVHLDSADEATWREAQCWFVKAGVSALPAMAELAVRSKQLGDRVRSILGVGMLTSMPWDAVRKHPALQTLAQPSVNQGRRMAQNVAAMKSLVWEHHVPARLQRLVGFAVPAVASLMAHSNPVARAYAIRLKYRMGALMLPDQVKGGSMRAAGDDWVGHTSVSKVLATTRRTTSHAKTVPRKIEHIVMAFAQVDSTASIYALINPLRSLGNTFSADTWMVWWKRARPIYRVWWATRVPNKRAEWTKLLDHLRAFRLERTLGASKLKILAPVGATARVYWDGNLVAAGTIPLEKLGAPKRSLRIQVAFDKCIVLEKSLSVNRNKVFSIWVRNPTPSEAAIARIPLATAPDKWWERGTKACPKGITLKGSAPGPNRPKWAKKRYRVYCASVLDDVDDVQVGPQTEWDRAGMLRSQGHFANGERHGLFRYHYGGIHSADAAFRDGGRVPFHRDPMCHKHKRP